MIRRYLKINIIYRILITIVLILLVGIAGYFLGKSLTSPEKSVPEKNIIASDRPTETDAVNNYENPKNYSDAEQFPDGVVKRIFPKQMYGLALKDTTDPDYSVDGNIIYHVFYANKNQMKKINAGISPIGTADIQITTFTVAGIGETYIFDNFQLIPTQSIAPENRKNNFRQKMFYSQSFPPTIFIINEKETRIAILSGQDPDLVLKAAKNLKVKD